MLLSSVNQFRFLGRFRLDGQSDDPSVKFSMALGLLLTLVCAVLLTYWRTSFLDDQDTWWHITVGADIWRNREFPTHDTYSHTFYGQPWIAKEWLAQIILYLGYSVGESNAVVLIAASSICLVTSITYQFLSRHLRPIVAAVITVAIIFVSSPTFLARPHIFTLPLIVVWTYNLFESGDKDRCPSFWNLAILVVWANLHASFTLGFVIAIFAFLDFLERTRLADKVALTRWLIFLALCPIATMVHPYLYKAALVTLDVMHGNEAVPFIAEWQPFSARDYKFHEVALLLMLFGFMTTKFRLPIAKTLFILAILHLFLSHVRFAYAFFLLTPLIIARDVAAQFPTISAGSWKSGLRDPVEKWLANSFRPVVALILLFSVGLVSLFLKADIKPNERVYAAEAIAFVREHKIAGNVINSYDFGGPLIFNGIKTYVDGRTDQLFLNGFTNIDNETAKPGNEKIFFEVLERYKIGWSLLRAGDPRIYLLDHLENWQRHYEDKFAVIHVRKINSSQALKARPDLELGN